MSVLVSGSFSKEIDRFAIEKLGMPSLGLMERASEGLSEKAEELLKHNSSACILVVSGMGNNGADGLNAAYILRERGYGDIRIAAVGDPDKRTEEFRYHEDRLKALGVSMEMIRDEEELSGFDPGVPTLIIDALFGIGLRREVRGVFLSAICLINRLRDEKGSLVLSADVPSGLDSDLGRNLCGSRSPVRAHGTVTFGFDKTGLWLGSGPLLRGRLWVHDIGYPEDILNKIPHDIYDVTERSDAFIKDLEYKLKYRGPGANKSTYGKVLIIAGSPGMAGAAYLSGLSALRGGIGMARYFGPEENRIILQTLLPEAMYDAYGPAGKTDPDTMTERLHSAFTWADHFILGPGLSCSEDAEDIVNAFAELWDEDRKLEEPKKKLLVIDADGLNILSGHPELRGKLLGERTIITPHVGEMARLTGSSIAKIKEDPLRMAREFATSQGTGVILKDAVTVISDCKGRLFINTEGSAALAKAGSGDVLTGAVCGICAVLSDDITAGMPTAVCLHGRAGSLASRGISEHGTLARETAEALPKAFPG